MIFRALRGLLITVALLACGFTVTSTGQVRTPMDRLVISGHRPLSDAIVELVKRHGWAVTYEDSFYDNPAELQDITHKVAKPGRSIPKQIFTYEGHLDLAYSKNSGPDSVVKVLLDAYHKSGHGSYEFRAIRSGSTLHVLPSASADASGRLRARQSRLELSVTVPAGDRTVYEFIEAVLNEVNRLSRIRIDIGFFPMNAFTQTKFTDPVRNDTARNAIERALAATGRQYSWQLLCGAGRTNAGCGITFIAVQNRP